MCYMVDTDGDYLTRYVSHTKVYITYQGLTFKHKSPIEHIYYQRDIKSNNIGNRCGDRKTPQKVLGSFFQNKVCTNYLL